MIGVYTILGITEHGWGSTADAGLGAVSAILVAVFVVRQDRIANPLMPLRLFRSRNVAGANAIQALLVAGMFGDVLPRRALPAAGARLRRRSRSASPSCRRRS